MNIYFLVGAVIGILILSTLVSFLVFRKVESPKKQVYSVIVAYLLSIVLAGYGSADGGQPQFLAATINYGIASVILLSIQLLLFHFQKKKAS